MHAFSHSFLPYFISAFLHSFIHTFLHYFTQHVCPQRWGVYSPEQLMCMTSCLGSQHINNDMCWWLSNQTEHHASRTTRLSRQVTKFDMGSAMQSHFMYDKHVQTAYMVSWYTTNKYFGSHMVAASAASCSSKTSFMLISLRSLPWLLAASATAGTHQAFGICSQRQMPYLSQASQPCSNV